MELEAWGRTLLAYGPSPSPSRCPRAKEPPVAARGHWPRLLSTASSSSPPVPVPLSPPVPVTLLALQLALLHLVLRVLLAAVLRVHL